MKSKWIAVFSVFALFGAVNGTEVRADSWPIPGTETTISPNGVFRLTLEPAPNHLVEQYFELERQSRADARPNATAKLERKGEGDRWNAVWSGPLANLIAPVSALVADDGRYVVTFDNWYSTGHGEDVLVIYRADGALVRSMQLIDLVPQMYKDSLPHTVSSVRWLKGAEIQPDGETLFVDVYVPDDSHMGIQKEAVRFSVSLADGEVTLPSAVAWEAALSHASDMTLQRIDGQLEWLERMRNPIGPPTDCNPWRWRTYLEEVYQRLRPVGSRPSYASEHVLLPPESEDHGRTFGNFKAWLRNQSVGENHMAVAAPCAEQVLVQAAEDIAQNSGTGWHRNVTLLVAVDKANFERIAKLLEPSAVKAIWLNPDVAIPQRVDRIPGSDAQIAARKAEQLRLRREIEAEAVTNQSAD